MNTPQQSLRSTREGFGEAMLELGAHNKNVVALCADLTESLRLQAFAEKYPDRFFQVGVAEQNMMGVAAGLALAGKIPFAASFAAFNPGRNFDQIRASVAYSQLPVIIVGGHAGLSTGEDGATHQALEDIALMRVLPNMTVIVPADFEETKKAVHALSHLGSAAYLRLTREKFSDVTERKTPFTLGKAQLLKEGTGITIVGCGPILSEAFKVREILQGKVSIEIINLHTIKPLDAETIVQSLKKTKAFITLEEHQRAGGMYSALLESLAHNPATRSYASLPHQALAVDNTFGESGTAGALWKKYGLNSAAIEQSIHTVLEWKHA